MKFINTSPPFIRAGAPARSTMGKMLLCLSAMLVYSAALTGPRVLVNAAAAALTCVFCEFLVSRLSRLPDTVSDLSALVTGLVITALLPVTAPLWLVVLLCCFALLAARAPFGGLGHNPFNPAACAMAFGSVCFPGHIFRYPALPQLLPVFGSSGIVYGRPPLCYLADGAAVPYRFSDLLLGAVPGPAGTGGCLILAVCLIYLLAEKVIRWEIPLASCAALLVLFILFPGAGNGARVLTAFQQLLSGYFLFAAAFMFTDPSTSPKSSWAAVVYGLFCGLAVFIIRKEGSYRDPTCFAVILCNAMTPVLDRWSAMSRIKKAVKRRA